MAQTGESLLEEIVKALLGDLETASTDLPGGTVGPDEASDNEYLDKVAEMLVAQAGVPHGERRATTLETVKALLRPVGIAARRSGMTVPEALRRFAGVRAGTCELVDVARQISRALHVDDLDTFARIVDTVIDYPATTAAILVPDDPDDDDPDQLAFEAQMLGIVLGPGIREAGIAAGKALSKIDSPRKTSSDGNLAHLCIQLHYFLQHQGNVMIFGQWVAEDEWIGSADRERVDASTNPLLGIVKKALVGVGKLKEPDILDMTTREVYEIKPATSGVRGLWQLYLRYLFPLNAQLFGGTFAAALLSGLTLGGGVSATLAQKPFLPGYTWQPSPFYVLPPARLMVAFRPAPGLIVYEIFDTGSVTNNGEVPEYSKMKDEVGSRIIVFDLLVTMIITVIWISEGAPMPMPAPSPGGVVPPVFRERPIGMDLPPWA
jgi:hypothetical protein